ncbi:MAG TPA: regulatory iron-sulfur-containing complex subunit RicT [Phycisphaerales bacterium]|nr:regulatory iron-sulfur-containing complex subunit RicT [Phycisphaerales bacterium]
MPIHPLPQFEADLKEHLAEEDRRAYEAMRPPSTVVVRFGSMKLIGEFQYKGAAKPGCGSKLVVRTFRGTELGEMLTSTCPNSGCSKSVSRQEMLGYIENSGGQDYPFYTEGRVVRIATPEDVDAQAAIEQRKHELKVEARRVADRFNLPLKIVEVEPVLGGESVTVFYSSEERLELRDLARELGHFFRTRTELRHVGARDEARLTADYEKCGQYCCCKAFLKVLKPVSMKSAKVQKATLDPLKISGRCGRLMCCLRYEDQTYDDLAKRLPRKKSRVGTPEGDGTVIDSQILTQLVLVLLDEPGEDGKARQVAIPVENLTPPTNAQAPVRQDPPEPRGQRPMERRPGPPAQRPTPQPQQAAQTPPPAVGQPPQAPRPPQQVQPLRDRSGRPLKPRQPEQRGPQRGPDQPPRQQPPQQRPPRDEIDELLGGDLAGDDPMFRGPRRDGPRPPRRDGPNRPPRRDGPPGDTPPAQ